MNMQKITPALKDALKGSFHDCPRFFICTTYQVVDPSNRFESSDTCFRAKGAFLEKVDV